MCHLNYTRPDAFIIANPWDPGSAACYREWASKRSQLQAVVLPLRWKADEPTLDEKLAHCRAIVAVTDIPVAARMATPLHLKTLQKRSCVDRDRRRRLLHRRF